MRAKAKFHPQALAHYHRVLDQLTRDNVPFLIAGAAALHHYAGIFRDTKDLDLFCEEGSLSAVSASMERAGLTVETTDSRWIAKVAEGEYYVDFIFNSYHGKLAVTADWIKAGTPGDFHGLEAPFVSPEHLILTKCFMMHRDRFDGADINHVILRTEVDWERLLRLFDAYPELLFGYLLQFRFIYPREAGRIPETVWKQLRDVTDDWQAGGSGKLCRGSLVSRYGEPQYRVDYEEWGYREPEEG